MTSTKHMEFWTVSQNQANLKQLDWDIHWLNALGEANVYRKHFWLNKYSMYWEQYGLKDFSYLQEPELEVEGEQ